MVLSKGDPERGAILLLLSERGEFSALLERTLQANGGYGWSRSGPASGNSAEIGQYVERCRRSDPDCWILELDIPDSQRFIAETTADA